MRLSPALPLVLAACVSSPPDTAADRAELLRMHDMARADHLEKRADRLVSKFADSMRSVAAGRVTISPRSETQARLQAYFDQSTFQEWDDLAPPFIEISPDGRMAYKIVQKRVRLTAPDSTGRTIAEDVVFAWVEIYRKPADGWTLVAIASTDRPGPP